MGTCAKKQYKKRKPSKQQSRSMMFKGRNLKSEPFCYDGPKPDAMVSSITSLLADLLEEQELSFSMGELERLVTPLSNFIREFFTGLVTRTTGEQCEVFGTNCKTRNNDLVNFLNVYLSDTAQVECIRPMIFMKSSGGDSYSIPISEIKYLPKRLQGMFLLDTETNDIQEHIVLTMGPGFYSELYKFIIYLTNFYNRRDINSFGDIVVQQTFLLAVSLGNLFERTNQTKDIKAKAIQMTLDMLTGKENTLSYEVKELFDSVVYDLDLQSKRREHYPYVQELRAAFRKSRNFLNSTFEVSDLYMSTRATASEIDKKRYFSIASSLFELDPIIDIESVKIFDQKIGFESSDFYRSDPLPNYRGLGTKTIWINNPNKRKPRAIHIAMNAVQDRCKWIHRRSQAFLEGIPSDCMINHNKGVEFLKRYTSSGYRLKHHNSILNFDFSNATDTLSTEFQYLVVDLFHGKEVADFWKSISTLPKVAITTQGELPYIQTVGQPQGVLGSFDLFSEAHHMILLMVMKATNREGLIASEFYHLVGDDSAINTVTPDPEGLVSDWYNRICTEANLIVNLSKSHVTSGDPTEDIILDFAKTTVRNGQIFSALPVGLALSYCDKEMLGGIAANLWYSSKGMPFKKAMDSSVSRNFRNYTQRLIVFTAIKSGQIPYLQIFEDKEFIDSIPEDIKIGTLLSFLVNMARSTVFDFCLSEKDREKVKDSDLSLQYAWDSIFPPNLAEDLISWLETAPINNKYSYLIEDSFSTQRALRTIYDNLDELTSKVIATAFHDKDLSILTEVQNWLSDISYQEVTEELKPAFWYSFDASNYYGQLNTLNGMHIPSFVGKTKQQARLFKGLIPTFKGFFKTSEYISGLIDQVTPGIAQEWVRIDDFHKEISSLVRKDNILA